MFETKLAEDIRRKLSSINPNLKDEPHLLVKACIQVSGEVSLTIFSHEERAWKNQQNIMVI